MDQRFIAFHLLTAGCLFATFILQSVLLNLSLIQHFNASPYGFLWFLGDFFCLLVFSLDFYLAYRAFYKRNKREIRTDASVKNGTRDVRLHMEPLDSPSPRPDSRSSNFSTSSSTSEYTWPSNTACFNKLSRVPMTYLSWLLYATLLIAKVITIFKCGIIQGLPTDVLIKPQAIKLCIGLSALVYTFLVEAHKDTEDDPVRNAYVNSLSFGIAAEILDSVSFLSLLIGSESGLVYSFGFEDFIIGLASVNFMLPSIALYKLSKSGYGKTYHAPLETLYKTLHLFLVNGSYLGVRLYLWYYFHPDASIFIIKNVYAILVFIRDVPGDMETLYEWAMAGKDGARGGNAYETGVGRRMEDGDNEEREMFGSGLFGGARRVFVGEVARRGATRITSIRKYNTETEGGKEKMRRMVFERPGRVFVADERGVGVVEEALYEKRSSSEGGE